MTTVNFTAVKNDTFDPTWVIQFLQNDLPIDLTGASIKADYRIKALGVVALSMSTDNGKIEIIDAVNGKIRFAKQVIDIDARKYVYDIEITFLNGDIKTYIKGTMTVLQDITYT